jgi:hypothetical protein
MVVTDVTRMEGARVCVGGYLEDDRAVRPVIGRSGPDEAWLQRAQGGPVAPFAVVDLRISGRPKGSHAPHTEDRLTPQGGQRVQRMLTEQERIGLLERTCAPSVRAIFGADVHAEPTGSWGRYVLRGQGKHSLGTIRADEIADVIYRHYPERSRWDYRLRFRDAAGEVYQLAVVDLAFRRQLDQLRDGGLAPDVAAATMRDGLREQRVYLRVGLARGWDKHPDRCYLQLTGVYGFGGEAVSAEERGQAKGFAHSGP